MAIAIDFGTSNTVIARWNESSKSPEIVKGKTISQQVMGQPPLIPSLLYVKNGAIAEVILGQQVRDQGLDLKQDPRFFQNFKRGIGATIQGFLPEIDGVCLTFEQVGQWFLEQLIPRIWKP
jgi:molecular chaperone DnaK (HSP70)